MAGLAILLAVGACGGDPKTGVIGQVVDGLGGVVTDEPTATIAARDVLAEGGTATDAVIAAYFALAATYPVAAGLGGGGVCVVNDAASRKAETIDFTMGHPGNPRDRRFAVGIPGNVRGMAALHSRYGRLEWARVLQPGERLARFGYPISRALSVELKRSRDVLLEDRRARALLTRSGRLLREGEELQQLDLAGLLGRIRVAGAGAFYNGPFARRFVRGVRAVGGDLSVSALRRYRPVWRAPETHSFGRHDVHFPPAQVGGGNVASRLWDLLKEKGRYRDAPETERDMAIVRAQVDAYSGKGIQASLGGPGRLRDPAVTSFAAIDRAGGAAACAVTMNGAFGTGRVIPETGLFAARAELSGGGQPSLAAMIITNRHVSNAYFAAGASGDSAGPASLISVALKVLIDGQGLDQAIRSVRFHPGARPKSVIVEAQGGKAAIDRFKRRGFQVWSQPFMARVNAIYCADGIRENPLSCRYAADRRGYGYAIGAGR